MSPVLKSKLKVILIYDVVTLRILFTTLKESI